MAASNPLKRENRPAGSEESTFWPQLGTETRSLFVLLFSPSWGVTHWCLHASSRCFGQSFNFKNSLIYFSFSFGVHAAFSCSFYTLLSAGAALGSRLQLGGRKVAEPNRRPVVSFCPPPAISSELKQKLEPLSCCSPAGVSRLSRAQGPRSGGPGLVRWAQGRACTGWEHREAESLLRQEILLKCSACRRVWGQAKAAVLIDFDRFFFCSGDFSCSWQISWKKPTCPVGASKNRSSPQPKHLSKQTARTRQESLRIKSEVGALGKGKVEPESRVNYLK